ncbi:MAG: DNA repair protein RecN [Bacteroidota bacterium]|jgi:DNA repair protein RecN (Recombination protein N)
MLRKLSIDNYILIHDLEIDFFSGFSVITGETGSGKSILLGALNLILGQRADNSSLLDKTGKCIVEGQFIIKGYNLESFFSAHDLDYEDIAVLRREINQNGKSRAFINDTPVNLSLLKELGDKLVNIHSQNSVITLNEADFQLAILDSYAGQTEALTSYQLEYRHFAQLRKELEECKNREARTKGELDYYRFMLDELLKATLKDGEQEESEQRLDILSHAEEIKSNLFITAEKLGRAELNLLSMLNEVIAGLIPATKYHPAVEDLASRMKNNQIDLKDILKDVEKLEEDVQFDPEEQLRLSQRIDLIYRLEKKHQVQSIKELLNVILDIEDKINIDDNLEQRIKSLEDEITQVHKVLFQSASQISEARKAIRSKFENEVTDRLGQLGMPASKFIVDIKPLTGISMNGIDQVCFMFSANKGILVSEVSKVASGGELSRLMLTIKSMVSRKNLLPTIIFDEIDNGVSGDIAGKVGNILKGMSSEMQVIVITHLPQIAGKGEHHYNVFKSEGSDITMTLIRKLKNNERVEEIAKMMSNENITAAAMKTARELLAS